MWVIALSLTAAGSGAAWAKLAARRAGEPTTAFAIHALLGGAAAFGLALAAYEAATGVGFDLRWDQIARGDAAAFLFAAAVGLVEEGAKLTGLLLVIERGVRTRVALAAAVGVAAGFSALETVAVLGGERSGVAFTRAALGPVAHALLAVPFALAVAPALRSKRPARALVIPLLTSAALHGAGDLSLAIPGLGPLGYGLALAAPALMLFAHARARRRRTAPGAIPTWK
ncbi:MAG TPA: PrsW family glutamic-type intramembrane protease [Anaeromyxobacter sp.]